MLSDYEALEYMNENGSWPKGHPSLVVKELCKKYDVYTSSPIIVEHIMKTEINRLRKTDKGHAASQVDVIRAEIVKVTRKTKEKLSSLTGRYTRYRLESRKKLAEYKDKIEDLEYKLNQNERDAKYYKDKVETLFSIVFRYATVIAIQRDMGISISKEVLADIPDLQSRCYCGGIRSVSQNGVDAYGNEIFRSTCLVCEQTVPCNGNSYNSPLDRFENELKSRMSMYINRKWQTVEEWKEEKN